MDKPLVFVSCGQWSESECGLGKDICDLIRTSTSYEPYFAQNQSGLDGLTIHILGALDRAAAFLGVMHHRGTFQNVEGITVTRASVWIEQEIAIAAYLRQIAKRQIEIRLFIQNGIALEGVRQHLIANPIFFDANSEVLAALPSVLSEWKLQPISHSIIDPRAKEILVWKEAGHIITVRAERPKGPQALIGNQNWPGERECRIADCTNFTVYLDILGYGTSEALPLEMLMISHDTMKHRPMLIVKA